MLWWTLLKLRWGTSGMKIDAAESLQRNGDVRAVDVLIAALRRGDREVCMAAISGPCAVAPLASALDHGDVYVGLAAVKALAGIDDPGVIDPLISAVYHSHSGVRDAAVEALATIRNARVVRPLADALCDSDFIVRRKAVEALAMIRDPRAGEPLIGALGDSDWDVRQKSVTTLAAIRDPRAVEPLIDMLNDSEFVVRWEAAEALGEFGDHRVVEPLIGAACESDSDMHSVALRALAKIKDPQAFVPLVAFLHEGPEVWSLAAARRAAAEALLAIGDGRAVEPLIETLSGRAPAVPDCREVIRRLLERSAHDVSVDSLLALTRLETGVELRWGRGGACTSPYSYRAEVDCAQLRQLARQELIRRGIEA